MSDRERDRAEVPAALLDWAALEQALTDQLVSLVREVRRDHPDDDLYGASVHEFFVDGDQIGWPNIGVASEQKLATSVSNLPVHWKLRVEDLRWDGPDFHWQRYPGDEHEEWKRKLLAEATSVGLGDALRRFNQAVVTACERARDELVADGTVGGQFLVVPLDDDGELTRKALTSAQLEQNFPELAAQQDGANPRES